MECKTLEQRQQMKESDIEALQNLLIKNSFRSHDGDGRNMFITAHRLQKIWTESLLTKTFGGFSWATRDFLTIIQADLLKVLSTLVSIGWSDFENFKDIFHDQPGRQDVDLPFEIEHDSFTTSMAQRFRNEQYKFIPITIRENRDEQFSASFRLPFVRESETIADKGSYCVVYKEIVAPRQLVDIDETPNAEETPIVRKSCAVGQAGGDVQAEIDALKKFRYILFDNERICTNFCTITHGLNLDILSPCADLDLEDLLSDREKARSIEKTLITPQELLLELVGLANAVDYLHHNLRTSKGEFLVCIHNDLKPENILIFHHSGAPLGRWKIADFGLARFKELKEDKTIERTYLNFQDPSYRYAMPSLTSPKRAPGSFQAPEVEKQGEKVIGPESDIFSLGGISSRILTFAIGRTKYLHKFDRMRGRETCDQDASNSHTHDFFHRNGGQEINTQVLLWLDDLSRENPGLECWIQPWVQIIKKMLEIDPQKRPEAKNVERVLLDDVLPKIVKGNNSTTPPKSPKRPKRSRDSSPQPPISNKRKCFKVKIPDSDIIQTCFSRSHEYAAFLSPCNIHVISFKNLDRENHWTEKEVEEGFVPGEGLVLDIPASDSAFWRAMAISNDYLIARTADAVFAYRLKINHQQKLAYETIPQKSKFKDQLLGVSISSKGDVILQFEQYLELYIQGETRSHPLEVRGILQSAIFSTDGDWILAWSADRGSMFSYFWQLEDLSQSHREDLSPITCEEPCSMNRQILALSGLTCFAAWDEPRGQVRIVHGPPSTLKESILKSLVPNIKAGIISPAANTIVVVRSSEDHSNNDNHANDQVTIASLCLNSREEIFESGPTIDLCKIEADLLKSGDIAVDTDSKSGLVKLIRLAHSNGFFEEIELQYD